MAKGAEPKRTGTWLLENEVVPRLDRLETGQGILKQQIIEAGLNGHSVLLREFLDDQAARKKSREARDKFFADVAKMFAFLRRPRSLAFSLVRISVVAAISAYFSAIMFGKLPPPPPFNH